MVDFDIVHNHYSNEVAQPCTDLLHALMELGYASQRKEEHIRGSSRQSFSICVRQRERKKGFSWSLLLRKKIAVGLPIKSTESAIVCVIISLQHIQVPAGDAPDVQRLHTLQGNWLRLS